MRGKISLGKKWTYIVMLISILIIGGLNSRYAFGSTTNSVTERIAGSNRFETSVAISKAGFSTATTVIIASGLDYPDALAASSLSKLKNAPILLTGKDALETSTLEEIKRLKATTALLVGGVGVVGTGIEDQLTKLGVTFTRIGGSDRYDTSKKVAEIIGVNNGAIIVGQSDFPDALSITPIAAIKKMPILLSPRDALNPNIAKFINDSTMPIPKTYLVGGSGVLDAAIEGTVPNSKRLSGNDRYITNLSINQEFAKDMKFDKIYLASGKDFPDALSGSALAARNNAPIFLTDGTTLSDDVLKFFKAMKVKQVVILGGTAAVSEELQNNLNDLLKEQVINPIDITLNKLSTDLVVGGTETLLATFNPTNVTNKSLIWTSSKADVVLVDNTGKLTGVGPGTATITCANSDKAVLANCIVNVTGTKVVVEVKAVVLNKTNTSIQVGKDELLVSTISPTNASNKYITWDSSDSSIARVDISGRVTAVSTGSAIITVYSADKKTSGTCNVLVTPAVIDPIPPANTSKIFAIDIGHNAKYDGGAVGIRSEDACTEEVGTIVIQKLKDMGYTVINCAPTNPTSTTNALKQRCDIANAAHADYYLAIHFNIFNGTASGSEIYMGSNKIKTKAQQVLNNLVDLGYVNRGLHDNSRGLYVLKNTNMPAMLVECSFLDSVSDMAAYDPEAIAEALVEGLVSGN